MINKISIIITTLNSSNVIRNILDSLSGQTTSDFDLIIIDGGSTDDTIQIINKYNVVSTLTIKEGLSIYEGINLGISFCKTQYYLVCGSDDELYPNAIEIILNTIQSNADLYIFSVYHGDKLVKGRQPNLINRIKGWQSIITSHSVGTVIKKKLHETLGHYETKVPILADGLFLTKLLNDIKYSKFISEEIIGNFGIQGTSSKNYYNNIFTTFIIQCKFYNFYLQLVILLYRLMKYRKQLIYNND